MNVLHSRKSNNYHIKQIFGKSKLMLFYEIALSKIWKYSRGNFKCNTNPLKMLVKKIILSKVARCHLASLLKIDFVTGTFGDFAQLSEIRIQRNLKWLHLYSKTKSFNLLEKKTQKQYFIHWLRNETTWKVFGTRSEWSRWCRFQMKLK